MQIANRASITVTHLFVAGAPFQRTLNVGFDADEVIIRQITYGDITNDVNASFIQTDLVKNGDGIIGHVIPNTLPVAGPPQYVNTVMSNSYCPNGHYPVNRGKINGGQATFNILTPVGANDTVIQNTLADGILTITLEFVQYI